MGPIMPTVSVGFAHPFPGLTVAVAAACPLVLVNVGPGSVIGVPAAVNDGSNVPGLCAELANEIIGGGHESESVTVAAICPAPAPPVCHELRVPVKGSVFPHFPTAARGSVGIHPY